MNRYLFIAALVLVACNSNKETPTNNPQAGLVNNPRTANGLDTVSAAMKPTMDLDDTVHEFGTIHQEEKVTHEFSFKNNGKSPLLITSAAGSCGCTVPEYPHDPVQPGQSGIIKVTFNSSGKSGHQEKSVTLHTNTLRSLHMLYIKGEVVVPKGGSDKLPTE
ncbi:MAG: DUF1573 domain-containing protein [Taibaiella sp.]|nr:DUF1573 domain-containing protein [Taibaiella sp.]